MTDLLDSFRAILGKQEPEPRGEQTDFDRWLDVEQENNRRRELRERGILVDRKPPKPRKPHKLHFLGD